MTAPTTPLAGASDADRVREALVLHYRTRGGFEGWVQQEVNHLLADGSPIASLLADREALRARAETERKGRESWGVIAHQNAEAADCYARECVALRTDRDEARAQLSHIEGIDQRAAEYCRERDAAQAEVQALRTRAEAAEAELHGVERWAAEYLRQRDTAEARVAQLEAALEDQIRAHAILCKAAGLDDHAHQDGTSHARKALAQEADHG